MLKPEPFISVLLSLDSIGSLFTNTEKNPPPSWLEPGTTVFKTQVALGLASRFWQCSEECGAWLK